jgi:hypothetical protein
MFRNFVFCTVKLHSHDWCICQTFFTCGYLPHCGNGALACFPLIVTECDTCLRNNQCLFPYEIETCCIPAIHLGSTSTHVTCGQSISFSMSRGQLHELWECSHSGEANIWQVCPSMIVCHINETWKQYC